MIHCRKAMHVPLYDVRALVALARILLPVRSGLCFSMRRSLSFLTTPTWKRAAGMLRPLTRCLLFRTCPLLAAGEGQGNTLVARAKDSHELRIRPTDTVRNGYPRTGPHFLDQACPFPFHVRQSRKSTMPTVELPHCDECERVGRQPHPGRSGQRQPFP